MKKASQISTANVTPEQIGRCHKCFSGSTAFYMVESESDPEREYRVTWDKEHGFRCSCPSGQDGFAHCKAGVCKHVTWSVAAAAEEREAVKELEAAIAEQALQVQVKAAMSDPATIEAAQVAAEAPVAVKRTRKAKPYQPAAFSILR